MSVSCSSGELFGGQGVEGDQGDRERDGGVGRVEGLADGGGVEGQRHGGVHRCGGHAPGRVGEDQLAGLEHVEQRPESVTRPSCVWSPLFGQRGAHLSGVISARDWWPWSAQACRIGAIPMMWMRAVWGSRERCAVRCAAVEHDVEPDLQLGSHRFGQAGGLGGEVSLDVGDPVVDEHAGRGEDIEGGG